MKQKGRPGQLTLRNKACLCETEGGSRGQGVCLCVRMAVQQIGEERVRERERDEVWNGKLRGRAKEEHGRIEEERGEEGNKTR